VGENNTERGLTEEKQSALKIFIGVGKEKITSNIREWSLHFKAFFSSFV